MSKRVFVTGLGLISGIGKNVEENLQSLLLSRSGIGRIKYLETQLKDEIPVSEVKFSLEELFNLAGIAPAEGYSRNALLGIIAAREAFADAGLVDFHDFRTALISATTVGGMDQCELYYEDFLNNDNRNGYIDCYDCADSTEKIAQVLGFDGFITTISTACSSSANSILLGSRMIRNGKTDRVIAGGCESLTRFHLNGFNALKILDKEPCKPFDQNRSGITLGEGAAYVVLESEETVKAGNKKVYAEVAGWGNSCEAFHQTASSPDGTGAFLAMQKALQMSGLDPEEIAYINAHGTGTDNNDIAEGNAIMRLFGEKIPAVSSTKPFTGHTTSAAGSTEAIISILSLNNKIIWPSLNIVEPMHDLSFQAVREFVRPERMTAVMSNSFGFGGNDTSLIFKKGTI